MKKNAVSHGHVSRRKVMKSIAAAPLLVGCAGPQRGQGRGRATDIRIVDVRYAFEDFSYRAPYHFGGRKVSKVTLLNVGVRVRTRDGKTMAGYGSMSMGTTWAFPAVDYEASLAATKVLAGRLAGLTRDCDQYGHPIELNHALHPAYLQAAAMVSSEVALQVPMPDLCTLLVASPFDAAIHDAYGKLHGVSSYETYGSDWMNHDLSAFLGAQFAGLYPDAFLQRAPAPKTKVFHSVGAGDPLTTADVAQPLDDGLPNTLEEWIRRDGIVRFKIKLNGGDVDADFARTVAVDAVVNDVLGQGGNIKYCLDFNEGCRDVAALIEFLRRFKEASPEGFDRILYVEQPTQRDLVADRDNVMHAAAKLRPVVIDESLTDLGNLLLAREMGYSGLALKACKGQSHAVLMAAAGKKLGMLITVQDLTCPGAALIHSAGIAAHVPDNAGIEANARQFVPVANQPWVVRFPGIMNVHDGHIDTASLKGPGLGAVPPGDPLLRDLLG